MVVSCAGVWVWKRMRSEEVTEAQPDDPTNRLTAIERALANKPLCGTLSTQSTCTHAVYLQTRPGNSGAGAGGSCTKGLGWRFGWRFGRKAEVLRFANADSGGRAQSQLQPTVQSTKKTREFWDLDVLWIVRIHQQHNTSAGGSSQKEKEYVCYFIRLFINNQINSNTVINLLLNM